VVKKKENKKFTKLKHKIKKKTKKINLHTKKQAIYLHKLPCQNFWGFDHPTSNGTPFFSSWHLVGLTVG